MRWVARRGVALVAVAVALVGSGEPVVAQETRAELAWRARADKAKRLHPYKRTRIESVLYDVDDKQLFLRIFNPPRGLFAQVGSLVEEAGLAAGPAFRLSRPDLAFTVSSAVSTKAYWVAEGALDAPWLANGRLFAAVSGRWRSFPQQHFYGLGAASTRAGRSNFALRDSAVNGLIGARLTSWLSIAGGAEYLAARVDSGTDKTSPSVETMFTESTAPALGRQPDFTRLEARAVVDYSSPPDERPYAGGRYAIAYHTFDDRDLGRFAFHRWDIELQQYVPIIEAFRTIAFRALASVSDPAPGQEVPFYLQRTLGGANSLRGLDPYRLRDRNLLLLQAEYRWAINTFVTGALFVDAGTVAHEVSALNLRRMKRDYGMGIRLGSSRGIGLRADVAFGSGEGRRLMLRLDDVF